MPSRRALLQANYEVADLAKVGRKEDAPGAAPAGAGGPRGAGETAGGRPGDGGRRGPQPGGASAGLLEDTGKPEEAVAAYERGSDSVLADLPTAARREGAAARLAFADAGYAAGWLLRTIGRTDEARRAMEQARDLSGGPRRGRPEGQTIGKRRLANKTTTTSASC